MQAHGQFEGEVYRAFTEEDYAVQFISGRIRFCNVYTYRKIGDGSRRDETEGESHLDVNGTAIHSMFASTSTYVCCFHRTLDAAQESNFGPYIVNVLSPRSLAIDITNALTKLDEKFFGGVEGVIVKYTKGDAAVSSPGPVEMAWLNYTQKPRDPFERENEFRLVILSKKNFGDIFTIDIGKPVDNCHLL